MLSKEYKALCLLLDSARAEEAKVSEILIGLQQETLESIGPHHTTQQTRETSAKLVQIRQRINFYQDRINEISCDDKYPINAKHIGKEAKMYIKDASSPRRGILEDVVNYVGYSTLTVQIKHF